MNGLETLHQEYWKNAWGGRKTIDEKDMLLMAEDVIKYQNYKVEIAVDKMRGNATYSNKKNYFMHGRNYLETEKKSSIICQKFYSILDDCVARCVQPLTPSESERRMIKTRTKKDTTKYQKKDAVLPISKIEVLNKPITGTFEYGIKIGKIIYLQDSETEANGFLNGIKAMNGEGKLVRVEIDV